VLGVPTIADRVAQTVVARRLEARVEPIFHPDSYGYRPNRSGLDAVATCRQRCWKYDWAIDCDVEKFFDSVPWDLVIKAVETNTDLPWVVLYVKRWLHAPLLLPDGTLQQRDCGTPQGSAVSPVLANLFLHYAFDSWMARTFPAVPFERYADDVVVHCVSQRQAQHVRRAIENRMVEVGLRLHPDKTTIVYCKDGNRRARYKDSSFTFLGYTFRARAARDRNGNVFTAFLPAVSKEALKRMSRIVRGWRLHRRTDLSAAEIAEKINPVVRGWMNYYGAFYRSALSILLARINTYLVRWTRKKYKRLRARRKARTAWDQAVQRHPRFFAHWAWVTNPLMIKMVGAE
jgi:group II intron reverse transcriptase/maturase